MSYVKKNRRVFGVQEIAQIKQISHGERRRDAQHDRIQ